jgi:hypothetical protein
MVPHRNIHKYTWTSPDVKTHNQIDHNLVDKRRHSNILDVLSYRAADYETVHYLMDAEVRERLAVNKQRSQRSHFERFNLKQLNEVKSNIMSRSQIGLQLWKFWTQRWKLIVLGKRL